MRPSIERHVRFGLILVVWSGILVATGRDHARAERPVDFDREIRPVLSEHCYQCHGPDQKARKADLRLDRKEDALRDRPGGAAIVPGKVEESELIRRITSGDPEEVMPPPNARKRLDAKHIALLRRWIAEGAKWEGHWSYTLPASVPAPTVGDRRWPRNAIDDFVLARLESQGLAPTTEADRATLIRRLSDCGFSVR